MAKASKMVNNPKADLKDSGIENMPLYLTEEYRNRMGRLLKLSTGQKKELKKKLKKEIETYRNETGVLQQDLIDDFDLVEGNVEETDFPWPGAANIDTGLTQIYMSVMHSTERRSILGADRIWTASTTDAKVRDALPKIEEMVNYNARNVWNIEQMINDGLENANRDGVCPLEITYTEEFEPASDVVMISSREEFDVEFPTMEDAGLTSGEKEDEAEWKRLQKESEKASDEEPQEVRIEFDKEVYKGPFAEVVDYANFMVFPATAPSISRLHARGYGKKYSIRKGIIQKNMDEGLWYKDEAKKLLKDTQSKAQSNQFVNNRNMVAGINKQEHKDDIEMYNLTYRIKFKGSEKEVKLMVTYNFDNDLLVQAIAYPYRRDHYAFMRIKNKTGRFRGESIPDNTRDMHAENDEQHNQRINSRTISTVPVFKAENSLKDKFDPSDERNRFQPGTYLWLDDITKLQQFEVRQTDLGESMAEERNNMNISDLRVGAPASLFSGKSDPKDPNAPGNKTQTLISQGNVRLDDPLNQLRYGIAEIGNIVLSHVYQFGPPQIEFTAQGEEGEEPQTLPKRVLRKNITLAMRGITVAEAPDREMQKWLNTYSFLVKDPAFAQNAELRINLLRTALREGRLPNWDTILPTAQQLEQIDIQRRAQAQQLAAEQQKAQQAEEVRTREQAVAKDASTQLKFKNLAKQKADQGVGGG